MSKKAREQGVPVLTLWKLTLKNMFSIIYFVIVGLLLAVVYTRFLVKPSFTASGNIENIGGVSHTLMPRIVTIATEPETLDRVVDFLEIAEEEKPSKKSEIKSNLTIANYNSTTMKIKVSYRGGNSEQVLLIINSVIDVTIERFIEESPANEGKIIKQRTPITATAAGLSNKIIYVGFVVLGAIFGVVIGVGTDLLKRKLYFESDVQEYGLPYNFMNINRKKKDETPIIENKAFVDGIVVLQDRLEGASRRTRTNVIGVVNLGYETYNVLPGLLADNTSTVGLKSLIIDLDFEHPSIHSLYNIESNEGITDILQNKEMYSGHKTKTGKFAETHYQVIKKGETYSLVDINILTGRKNQIRVHLKDIGYPIVGDRKYDGVKSPIQRLCLHAYELQVKHPIMNKTLNFKVKIPKDFAEFFK